jgi:capsular polysaccharide biosynthesis protein
VKRQLETFSRHRIALLLPILLALVVSSYYALSQPHKYESGVTVWFDTATPNPSSLVTPPGQLTPAAQGQQTLQEFLDTKQFLIRVGHRSPLAAILGRTASGPALDYEMVAILSRAFSVSVSGPQVVSISMTAADPSYIPGTLTALTDEYVDELTGSLQAREQASVAYYQTQMSSAQLGLTKANDAVSAYQESHPGASPVADPTYSQLVSVAVEAQQNFLNIQNTLQQADLTLQSIKAPTAFHVIDPAGPAAKLSNKKHMIFTVVAGLAAGLAISALALSALTGLDKTARRREDIEAQLGMEVVGTIHAIPRQIRIPGLRQSEMP